MTGRLQWEVCVCDVPLIVYKRMGITFFIWFDPVLEAGYSLQSQGGNSGSGGGGVGTDGRSDVIEPG